MKKYLKRGVLASAALFSAIAVSAQSDVTQPGDPIYPSSNNSPASEGVANAIDGKTTKYLNFDSGRDGNQNGTFSPSGFAVVPSVGLTRVTGMTIQSANDGPERDPDIVVLEGSNDTITNYSGGTWTQITTINNIAAGFTDRFQTQTFTFDNSRPYKAYRWTVNQVRTTPNGCCMQVAEVEFLGSVVPQDVTQPGDPILPSSNNSPASEGVANAIDNKTTKYLNFDSGRDGNQNGTFSPSGFVVTPAIGRSVVSGLTIQSANDGPERDPDIVVLEGSNDTNITSFATGTWEQITTISNIAAGFTARFQEQTFLFDNSKPYRSYRWTVNQVRTTPNGCCMQVAEVQFLGSSAPQDVTQPGDPVFPSSNNSPASEGVANVIDNKTTKYLNFDSGRDGNQNGTFSPSGFAVTPSIGASVVTGMTIESANDGPERDPDIVVLEGSNDAITSFGSGTWTPITTINNIAAGFTARFQVQEFYFPNTKSYKSYRWTVNQVRTTPNGCCMQVAEVELLAVTSSAPPSARFLSQPVDTMVISGQPATFYVTLNGPWPVQWSKNGTPIAGATKTTYTTDPITSANASDVYTVQILGRDTSSPVHGVVLTPSATKSVAVNFIGSGANGAPTTVDTNSVIGIWPQAYWNNATGGSGDLPGTDADGNPIPVLDSDGKESSIAFNYAASGTWGAGTGVDAPTDRMLNGIAGQQTVTDPTTPETMTFHNVPAGKHSVLIYAVGPPLQVQSVSYNIGSQTYYLRVMNSDEYNAAPGFYRSVSTDKNNPTIGDFVRFDNVSADASGDVVLNFGTLNAAAQQTGVNGIQLILNSTAAPAPPTITTQPASTVAASGGSARLSVVATGSNLKYQWRKNGRNLPNGANISGADSASLTIGNFADTDAGVYNVAIFDTSGNSVVSANASVNLSKFDINDALAVYLPFDESSGTSIANKASGGKAGTVSGTATWGAGKIANALTFDGSTYATVSDFTKPQKLMGVSAWVNADASLAATASFLRVGVGGLTVSTTNSGLFDFRIEADANDSTLHLQVQVAIGPAIYTVTDPGTFSLGAWHQVAFSVDGAQVHLYKDGAQVAASSYTLDSLNSPAVKFLTIGGGVALDPDTGAASLDTANAFVGKIDDAGIWNRSLGPDEVAAINTAGGQGKGLSTVVLTPPPVDTQPTITFTHTGTTLVLSWTGSGFTLQTTDALGKPYAAVPGVTGNTATITINSATKAAFYRLVK